MDTADAADITAAFELSISLRVAELEKQSQHAFSSKTCLNCGSACAHNFCDGGCRDDYIQRVDNKKRTNPSSITAIEQLLTSGRSNIWR